MTDHPIAVGVLRAGERLPTRQIGGKAYNLVRMLDAGLRVPEAFVLPVSFFGPWFARLEATAAWAAFVAASDDALERACTSLKEHAHELRFDAAQLAAIRAHDALSNPDAVFAVRS